MDRFNATASRVFFGSFAPSLAFITKPAAAGD
jgi:hypothetical protein